MRQFKEWLKRFKNTGTLTSTVGLIALLLIQFGMDIDMGWLENTMTIICSALIVLGLANNSETPGMDLPINPFNKKESDIDAK
ncbi:hypothetical protein [Clostridium ihumii]|uniref:hypothetical protein n=1 Tax=Clostridium ihumii TaxID=1470356 RepID=UPI0006868ED9|nr:hypothetical protein [Clostridium ihumii]